MARPIAGETILVPIRGNLADMERIFALNPVAGFVWDRIDGATTLEAIGRELVAEFDVDKDTATFDLHRFVTDMLEHGLVSRI